MNQISTEKSADKLPVWVIRLDGSKATLVEWRRFPMAIDDSRVSCKP